MLIVNQFKASCFANISPPYEITLFNRLSANILKARDLHEMFNLLGGYIFMVDHSPIHEIGLKSSNSDEEQREK